MNIIISWLALIVLCVLVRENDRLEKSDKRLFYLTYLLIAVSGLAEWLGLYLDGRGDLPKWLLMLAKCADYILTPLAGATLVGQMRLRNRWYTVLITLLVLNGVFQIAALFEGWMVVIDAGGHYAHGPLYNVYIGVYLLVIVIIGVEFTIYGKQFRRQNRLSLYAILLLVVFGIAVQEILGNAYRMVYVSLAFGAALMYIHTTEFSLLVSDDHLRYQREQMLTDPMTRLHNRHAYVQELHKFDATEALPEDFAAFMIDVNGLKAVNDSMGHEAGDELICGAAQCIKNVFASVGRCYRTGGDEFVVLADLDRGRASMALEQLERETAEWRGERVNSLRVSAGFAHAADHPGLTCGQLVQQADKKMYEAKAAYYRQNGRDRRRRRED
ncbi:MAG: GGDEF domain-containing protein [Clostridia bacterium]|nr:GGDEF domain-containing protein [Clostridia bacterium]